MEHSLIGYFGTCLVLVCSPGPDTALTIRNTVSGGSRCGVLTAVGVVTGQLLWAVAAAVGAAGLMLTWPRVFQGLRLAGGAYLLYLGTVSLRHAWRRRAVPAAGAAPVSVAPLSALRQGLLSNLANPKMGVVFLTLLPEFVGSSGHRATDLLVLGGGFGAITLTWLAMCSLAVGRSQQLLRRPTVDAALHATVGVVMAGLGLHVIRGVRL